MVLKAAVYLHTSTKRVDLDVLPYLKRMVINDADLRILITRELDLEPEELGFLLDMKPDSKEVKSVFTFLETVAQSRMAAHAKPSIPVEQKPPEPEPQPPAPKPEPQHKKNNQASLFDF